jgi:tRNA modification GTPase
VLTGLPNVGKSSLFNALAAGNRALVSDQPGTTRDYLTAVIDLEGLLCKVVDTAGLDSSVATEIEASAQRMTAAQAQSAEVTVVCVDSTRELNPAEASMLADSTAATRRLVVSTKCDEPTHPAMEQAGISFIATSARLGTGLDELRRRLRAELASGLGEAPGAVQSTAVRCRESLALASSSIERSLQLCAARGGEELIAADVRNALAELGKVVGAVYTDDILDRVFSRFCIGK